MSKQESMHHRMAAFQQHQATYGGAQDIRAIQTGISQLGHVEYKLDLLTKKVDKLIELLKPPTGDSK